MVDPKLFTDLMDARWTMEYGNVSSPALRAVWLQIVASMNSQIAEPRLPRPVMPAELGSGKTTAAKTFCALLPYADHPGVLIVVRTKDQADECAREINAWSKSTIAAFVSHSGVKSAPSPERLALYPTLVICHKGYELALDDLLVESHERYEKVMAFRDGQRRLVIVDEALDQVYVARIPQAALRRVLGIIHPRVLKPHLAAVDVIESVNRVLLEAPDDGNRVVSAEALLARTKLSVDEADAALVALWESVRASNLVKPDVRRFVKETLTALRRHLAAYRWTESERAHATLVGSRLLLPPDAGQVILDATGTLNNVYMGRPDAYEVRKMFPVRDYRSVTLYAARTKGTGKTAMAKHGEEIAQQTLDAVLAHFGERADERSVLVVTDHDSEDQVGQIWAKGGFAELDVAHWNRIDGRNEWREYDTLVVLNLPWATASLDVSTYMAVQGVELDDAGLNAPPDEVRTIRETRIAAQLAQALGRIRLRRMTKDDGTCDPCEAFVRFPHWARLVDTNNVIAGVQRALTGLQVVEWEAASTVLPREGRAPVARKGVGAALVAHVAQMAPGSWQNIRDVRQAIGATAHGTWFRVQSAATTPGHPLQVGLAELGVRIEPAIGRRPGRVVRCDSHA